MRANPLDHWYVEEDRGYSSPCWIWTGTRNRQGYGYLTHRGQRWAAHRLAYTLKFGPIPEGHSLDHLCNQGANGCCNPDHLEAVTQRANLRRRFVRTLKESDIAEIRELCASLDDREVLLAFWERHLERTA